MVFDKSSKRKCIGDASPRRVDNTPLPLTEENVLTLRAICPNGAPLVIPCNDAKVLQLVKITLMRVYKPVLRKASIKMPSDWIFPKKGKKANEDGGVEQEKIKRILNELDQCQFGNVLKSGKLLGDWAKPRCSQGVAQTVTELAFGFGVPSVKSLNTHYESFSSETYGETSLEQMASIIDELQMGPDDVVVDLGSGVGQLVCFTAAYANVKKVVGIELGEVPAGYSATLSAYFRRLVSHFGKQCSEYELYAGDFLHEDFRKLIMEDATIIFMNNFAFSPDLMNRVVNERLQYLKDGVRIITSKPLSNYRRGMSHRNQNDISALTDAITLKSVKSNVSWTDKTVTYTLQTMNSMKILKYYEENYQKNQTKSKLTRRKRKHSESTDQQ